MAEQTVNQEVPNLASSLLFLLETASRSMSVEQFQSIAKSLEEIHSVHTINLAEVTENLAVTFGAGDSTYFKEGRDLSSLLFTLSENLKYISTLEQLAAESRFYAKAKAEGSWPFNKKAA